MNTTPKTPRHPSNGYQVVLGSAHGSDEDRQDTSLKPPRSSAARSRQRSSPSKRPFYTVEEEHSEQELGVSVANNNIVSSPLKKSPCYVPTAASNNAAQKTVIDASTTATTTSTVMETPNKRRRKSSNVAALATESTPNSARRRSLRIQAKVMGESPLPSIPPSSSCRPASSAKKMKSKSLDVAAATGNNNGNDHGGNGNDGDERKNLIDNSNTTTNNIGGVASALFLEASDNEHEEDGSMTNQHPKRRRSLRIQAKMQAFEPTQHTATKSPSPMTPNNATSTSNTTNNKKLVSTSKPSASGKKPSRPRNMSALPPRCPSSKNKKKTPTTGTASEIGESGELNDKQHPTKIIGLSPGGHLELADALEKLAKDSISITGGVSSGEKDAKPSAKDASIDVNVASLNDGTMSPFLEKEVSVNVVVDQKDGVAAFSPKCHVASAGIEDKESNTSDEEDEGMADKNVTVGKTNVRRDTFDLSTRKKVAALVKSIGEECTPPAVDSATNEINDDCGSTGATSTALSTSSKTSTDVLLLTGEKTTCKPDAGTKDVLRKNLFDATTLEDNGERENEYDDVVSKVETCSTEESSLDGDEPKEVSSPDTVKRLQDLSSIAVEDGMKKFFSQFKVYNYPCVSARIFAAMSNIMPPEDFGPLVPLFSSFVNSEIVSLKNKDEFRDVYFINKKVCFSGFDYSSTVPAVDSISGSNVDLNSNIEALTNVLKEAKALPRPMHYLGLAIQCLEQMNSYSDTSDACAKTMVGYFPSSRFEKAIKHYLTELQDIQGFLIAPGGSDNSSQSSCNGHTGVRYRLGDFSGRSVRFHLRRLLNSIPEEIVDLNVEECEERWGRAVADWSISSVFNFALEKIDEFYASNAALFDEENQSAPQFFTSTGSKHIISLPRKEIKSVDGSNLDDLLSDIKEARAFLFGVRACKFVCELLQWPGVAEHVTSEGGWGPIESITSIMNDLQLYECVDNAHYVLLKDVNEFVAKLDKVTKRCEESEDSCEVFIRKLRRKLQPRKRESSFSMKGTSSYQIRTCLCGELEENFPLVTESSNEI